MRLLNYTERILNRANLKMVRSIEVLMDRI